MFEIRFKSTAFVSIISDAWIFLFSENQFVVATSISQWKASDKSSTSFVPSATKNPVSSRNFFCERLVMSFILFFESTDVLIILKTEAYEPPFRFQKVYKFLTQS